MNHFRLLSAKKIMFIKLHHTKTIDASLVYLPKLCQMIVKYLFLNINMFNDENSFWKHFIIK